MDNTVMTESTPKKGFFGKYVPTAAIVFFCVGILSAGLYAAFVLSPSFADLFNENISSVFRFVLAKFTYVFPFSVAEALLFASPVILFLILRGIFRYMDRHEHGFVRSAVTLVSTLFLLFSVFVFVFAAGYRGDTLDRKLGFEVGEVTESELERTAVLVATRLNGIADEIDFTDRSSVRGYTHAETVDKCFESYGKLSGEYPFIDNFRAPVKRLAVSPLMTYTHISGLYSFYTGEANLNTNYPEFVNVFTTAHEMAHQRGVAREDEANFTAYLVCIGSDDVYMQYSGYLNMLEYLVGELPAKKASAIYALLDNRIIGELVAYSEFFDGYRESFASDVTEAVSNSYLKSQGTEGTRSYDLVVNLAVAYHRQDISD
ncbi:MAG: DUF3810 domain-containing protein [Clostridia bacterium]|nr:DUF3810 domain-containing protein [Clostridia bacterium]